MNANSRASCFRLPNLHSESHANALAEIVLRRVSFSDLLHQRGNCLHRLICTLVRNITAKRVRECAAVIGEDLCVPLAARNGNVGHTIVEQIFGSEIGINMDEYAICRLSLAGVTGNSVAMVQMGVPLRIKGPSLAVIQLDLHRSTRLNCLHRPQLAVRVAPPLAWAIADPLAVWAFPDEILPNESLSVIVDRYVRTTISVCLGDPHTP